VPPLLPRLPLLSDRAARLVRRGRLLVAAGLLLIALVTLLGSARAAPALRPARRAVVVAIRDLPAGRVLRAADLARRSWPAVLPQAVAPGAVSAVVGRRLTAPLARGEPVTISRLLGASSVRGLAPGTVASSITVPDSTAGLVRPGDRVDVVAAPDPTAGATPPGARTGGSAGVVASDVLVLAALPADDGLTGGSGTRLVIATGERTAVTLADLAPYRRFAVVVDAP